MKKQSLRPSHLILLCLLPTVSQSQDLSRDSTLEAQAINHAVQLYHQTLTPENGLFNGSEYVPDTLGLTFGFPYYELNADQPGWVIYNHMRYDNLRLWYDLVKDQVAMRNPQGGYQLKLINERLQEFGIGNHHFVRIVRDSINKVHTDFYEVLVDGPKAQLLKRSTKNLQEYPTSNRLERDIYADSSFYLVRNDHFDPVNSKGELLSALKNQKSAVKALLRKNKLKFRKNKEEALTTVVAWYNGQSR
jgi:hypothetical protein